MNSLTDYIGIQIGEAIVGCKAVSGGDISATYKISTTTQDYFLKVNSGPNAASMCAAEKVGLETLKGSGTIAVPSPILSGTFGKKSFLLMEYVASRPPRAADFRELGHQVALLHQTSTSNFGFETDNFIGRLPQQNKPHPDWPSFYWSERLKPQCKWALEQSLLTKSEIPQQERALEVLQSILGEVSPSLIHGDLWGGNFLIATDGTPYLIDPAVYYGHSLVDIAMSGLFGGFGPEFYESYHELIPKSNNYEAQIELYRLYYLLAHLNMFGLGYRSSVVSILKRYF